MRNLVRQFDKVLFKKNNVYLAHVEYIYFDIYLMISVEKRMNSFDPGKMLLFSVCTMS